MIPPFFNNEIEKLQSIIYNKIFGKDGVVYSSNIKNEEYFFETAISEINGLKFDYIKGTSNNQLSRTLF